MLPLAPDSAVSFKPHLRLASLPSGATFLISETARFALAGHPLVDVAALIDGERTVSQLIQMAAPRIGAPEVIYALEELHAAGHLCVPSAATPFEQQVFWSELGLNDAISSLQKTPPRIDVRTVGQVENVVWRRWMHEALGEVGFYANTPNRRKVKCSLRLLLASDYRLPEFDKHNRRALRDRVPLLLVKPTGITPFIGPVLHPGDGPCWECLLFALRRNRPVEQLLECESRRPTPIAFPIGSVPASLRIALSMAAMAAALQVAMPTRNRQGLAHILELRFDPLQTIAHSVVRRPQCPVCGDSRLMRAQAEGSIRLEPVAKKHTDDGGFRVVAPAETFDRYRHLVSPISGAVSYVTPMPGRHSSLRAVYASGYLACPSMAKHSVPNIFDRACAGKGKSEQQARASALCEALERASSVYQGDEAKSRGSFARMGPQAVHPDSLQHFSIRQYEQRTEFNRTTKDYRRNVPLPFDEEVPIDWTIGWSITHDARRYVPLAYCFSDAPPDSGIQYCLYNPNGSAAGNRIEEAILQAILELVERDAAGIWWYNQICRPAVDLCSVLDPYVDKLIADYSRRGWCVWVLDLTHDLEIPVFAALANSSDGDRFAIGLGCHLDARVAIQRSLTELNQLFDPGRAGGGSLEVGRLRSRKFLFPARAETIAIESDRVPTGTDTLRDDILNCAKRLSTAGLELIVVNKTRPDWGVSVCQAIVPGLRHFWPRFAPGRLYSVSPKLRWLSKPLTEDELNAVELAL